MSKTASGGAKNKQNARQSMKNAKYYDAQYGRTTQNKARKLAKEKARQAKCAEKREAPNAEH